MKKIQLSLLALIISIGTFAQGRVDGFYKGKGNLDLVLGASLEQNKTFFAGKNEVNIARDITSVSFFAAYGIANKFDINVSLPYVSTGTESDIQDGAVYLKYQVLEKELSKGKLSFTMAAGYSTNLTDYQTEGLSAIGQQATVIDLRPVVHYFATNGIFATAQLGFQNKTDPTPNAFGAALKVGKAGNKFYYDFWYDFQRSDGGKDYRGITPVNTFKELGSDYHKIGGTYYRPIKDKLGFFVGASYTLAGRNIGQGYGVNAGIVLKR